MVNIINMIEYGRSNNYIDAFKSESIITDMIENNEKLRSILWKIKHCFRNYDVKEEE